MKKLWSEFVAFIMTGNVLMLAVAFILGQKTKEVIDAFVRDIINPIIGAIVGKPSFSNVIAIGKGKILIGAFITALIALVLVGLVLFGIVKVYDAYRARRRAAGEEPEEPTEDVILLREIRDLLRTQAR